ncbi:AAA family ATPase [Nostocoides sp. F2B08]|nr:AAA family ATPase [Tetrasphaera sp. F2B08]
MTDPIRAAQSSAGTPGVVWVVAGAPGAGKSTVADELRRRVHPAPALLDKDTLFAGFVDEVRRAHGRSEGEREGSWYDAHVKVHEYAGMTASAAQIRAGGCPVLLVAPFTTQIRDLRSWTNWVAALGGDPVRLVWVSLGPEALRSRLTQRGSGLDTGKLGQWEAFVRRTRPDTPPPVPHSVVDNEGSLEATRRQVDALVASFDTDQEPPTRTRPLS